jgi:hypothetical protein
MLPLQEWLGVVDLVVDRTDYQLKKDADHREPWRLALQLMLVSCSEGLTPAYHVLRWDRKIELAVARCAKATTEKDEMRLDPEDAAVRVLPY